MNRQIEYRTADPIHGQVVPRPAAATETTGPTGTIHMTIHTFNWAGVRRTRRLRNPKPALVAKVRKRQVPTDCTCDQAWRTQTVILVVLATVCATVATVALLVAAARGV